MFPQMIILLGGNGSIHAYTIYVCPIFYSRHFKKGDIVRWPLQRIQGIELNNLKPNQPPPTQKNVAKTLLRVFPQNNSKKN